MRTISDLISELEGEIPNFKTVALVIGFDDHAEYIWDSDQNKIEKLADMMERDGDPVGFLGVQMKDNTLTPRWRVLEEYKDERWANEYLESMAVDFIHVAQSLGAA